MSHKYPALPLSTRPLLVIKPVKTEFYQLGQRLYITTDERTFDADTYDRMYTIPKLKMLPKNHPVQMPKDGGRFFRLPKIDKPPIDKTVIITKICNHCKKEKDLERFHKNPNSRDGRRGDCITCVAEMRIEKIGKQHSEI